MLASTVPVDPFHAISDPTRRAILDRLRRGEAPVAEIAAGFAISRPAISKHLRILRDARLVYERPSERRGGKIDGRQRVYVLNLTPLQAVAEWTQAYQQLWSTNLANLKAYLETAQPPYEDSAP